MRPWLFRWQVDFLGDLSVPAYFFMITVAFLVATSLVIRQARYAGNRVVDVLDLTLWTFGAGLVGSRLGHVFFESRYINFTERWEVDTSTFWHVLCRMAGHPHGPGVQWNLAEYYWLHPHMVAAVWNGGVVYYGGVLLALPVAWWFCKRRRLDYWKTGDYAIQVLLVGLAFGRVGCLMAGCCYGQRVPAWFQPFAIELYSSQVEGPLQGVPIHATQLYESMAALAIVGFLMWLYRRRRYDGQVFATGVVLYGVWRYINEMFRADPQRHIYLDNLVPGGISTSQWISIGLIALAVILSLWLRSRRRRMLVVALNEVREPPPQPVPEPIAS